MVFGHSVLCAREDWKARRAVDERVMAQKQVEPRGDRRAVAASGSTKAPASVTRVFVSYSRRDAKAVEVLAPALSQRGYDVLVDRSDIAAAEVWRSRLGELILSADAVILLLSPDSMRSEVCGWEIERTLTLGKKLVPLVWRRVDPRACPEGVAARNWIFWPRIALGAPASMMKALCSAVDQDIAWERERSVWLDRAVRWDSEGRPPGRLLRESEAEAAEAWAMRRPASASPLPDVLLHHLQTSKESERADRDRRRLITARAFFAPMVQAIEAHEPDRALRMLGSAAALADDANFVLAPQLWIEGSQSIMLAPICSLADATSAPPNEPDDEGARTLVDVSSDGSLCAMHEAGGVTRLGSLADGSDIWRVTPGIEPRHLFVADSGDVVMLTTKGEAARLARASGAVISRARIPAENPEDDIYEVQFESRNGEIYAAIGAKLWRWSPDAPDPVLVAALPFDIISFNYAPEAGRGVAVLQRDGIDWTAVTISPENQRRHDLPDGVSSACVSADGSTFAIADRFQALVFDFASGAQKASVRHGDRPSVTGYDLSKIALSRNGRRLLTASNDATARVWDSASGQELWRFDHVDEALITDAFFAAEERAVVTIGTDCSARAWSAESGRCLIRIANRHNPKVVGWSNLGFDGAWLSRDGATFSTAITGGLVQIWRQRMLCERQLQADPQDAKTDYPKAWKVQASNDGAEVAIFRSDDTAHIADVASGDVVSVVKVGSRLSQAVMIEPWQAIVVCDARSSRCVARQTGRELWAVKHQAMVHTLAFDAGQNVLAIAGGEYGGATPGFVDVLDSAGSLRSKAEMSGWVSALCFHPQRQTMLIGDVNGQFAEWRSAAHDLSILGSFRNRIDSVAAPPEGTHFFVAAESALWRIEDDGVSRRKLAQLPATARSLQCDPSGALLFVDTVIGPRFFDVKRGAMILDLRLGVGAPGEEEFECCSITPDWRRLVGVTNRRRRLDYDLSGLAGWTGEPPAMLQLALSRGNHLSRFSERKDLLMAEQPDNLVAWLSSQGPDRGADKLSP